MAWVLHHQLCGKKSTIIRMSHSTTILSDLLSWMEQVDRHPSCRQLLRGSTHDPLSFTARTGRLLRRAHGIIEGQARECNMRRS